MKTVFVSILSAKGGVGKTTTAINLACALTSFGRNVLVVDGNYSKPNLGIQLGITKLDKHIHQVLRGEENIYDAVYAHPSGVKVVPGAIIHEELQKKYSKKLSDVMMDLKGRAEIVIIDSPPGFGDEVDDVIDCSDAAILVTTSNLGSITDTLRTKRTCQDKSLKILGVVLNKTHGKNYEEDAASIETIFDEPVISTIPFDHNLQLAQTKKYPIVYIDHNCPSSIAFKKLAANIIGEEYVPDVIEQESIFDYLLNRLGFK